MRWDKDRSTLLSMVFVAVFAAVLLLFDIFSLRIISWWVGLRGLGGAEVVRKFGLSLASLSIFAWICLAMLWRLLSSIRRGEVFTELNVKRLRVVSWSCGSAAVICLISGFYYPPFFFVFAAGAFMIQIVRVVKNCFQQACGMKDELDLTI